MIHGYWYGILNGFWRGCRRFPGCSRFGNVTCTCTLFLEAIASTGQNTIPFMVMLHFHVHSATRPLPRPDITLYRFFLYVFYCFCSSRCFYISHYRRLFTVPWERFLWSQARTCLAGALPAATLVEAKAPSNTLEKKRRTCTPLCLRLILFIWIRSEAAR